MYINHLKLMCLISISALITACGGGTSDSASTNASSVSMQYDISGFLNQSVSTEPSAASAASTSVTKSVAGSGVQATATFTSNQILRGELSATAIGGSNDGQIEVFAWTIYLKQDTLETSSNNTLTLPPGNYDFELLLTKGDQQYAGYVNQTLADGENNVGMTIKPVIGDFISDVTIIDRLAYFKFQYGLDDLSVLAAPGVGIQVDGDTEQIFSINTQTGMSNAFLNLPVGPHNLVLKLYDGAVQVGKSITAQENQTVAYGTDLAMDIVPLHGEMQFILTENGGDANLTVNVPAEVINEVGGVANLTATLALVGVKNPLQESALFFVEQADGSFSAEIIMTDLQYENVTLSLTFIDSSTSDPIASCNQSWMLNNQNQAINCDLTLIRRAVVSGKLLAVLGINVHDELGQPVSGAVVTNANGDVLGVTGSGTYGTAGYLKVYLRAGDHSITATEQATGKVQTASVSLLPLEVENVQLELAEPVPVGFTGDFAQANWTFYGVANYSMSESAFSISVRSHGGGKTASISIQRAGTISFDWAMSMYSPGQYGEHIGYTLNGTNYILSYAGTASGSATDIVVAAGDIFDLFTWGTTKSSSYSAAFTNLNFTAN